MIGLFTIKKTGAHKIRAIKNTENSQIIFSDTPGLEKTIKSNLNKHLNRTAITTALDADIVLFLTTVKTWDKNDEWALSQLKDAGLPVILVINKIDYLRQQDLIYPIIDSLKEKHDFSDIITISALKSIGLDQITTLIEKYLPEQEPLFPTDESSKVNESFQISETIREQLINNLHQELPYELAVHVEFIKQEKKIKKISAVIWVRTEGQKRIVIGKQGQMLKIIGTFARKELEKLLQSKIHLSLWVKIKNNWWDDPDFIERSKI